MVLQFIILFIFYFLIFLASAFITETVKLFKKEGQWALRQSTHKRRYKYWQHWLCFHRNTGNKAMSFYTSIRHTNRNNRLVQILGFRHLTIISYALFLHEALHSGKYWGYSAKCIFLGSQSFWSPGRGRQTPDETNTNVSGSTRVTGMGRR